MNKAAKKWLKKHIASHGDTEVFSAWDARHKLAYINESVEHGILAGIPGAAEAYRHYEDIQFAPESERGLNYYTSRNLHTLLRRRIQDANAEMIIRDAGKRARRGLPQDMNNPRVCRLPRGTPQERITRKRTSALRNGLSEKGISAYSEDKLKEIAESIQRTWMTKVSKFNDAAPRDTFVTHAEFHRIGADMAMMYRLNSWGVTGRGCRRGVRADTPPRQNTHYAAVLTLDGEEFIGVAKTQAAAVSKARGLAGESAAKVLDGQFEGGFL